MEQIGLKLAVISHAGIKRINRTVYAFLKSYVPVIQIVVPARLVAASGKIILPDPPSPGEAEVVPMELKGTNPRRYYYPALAQWLDQQKPDIILLENDPASNLGLRLSDWARKAGAKIICQTYDNTPRGIVATRRQQGTKAIPKNLLIHLVNYRMASKIDALLVVNKDSAALFNQYRYQNITQIPLGYDKKVFFPDEGLRADYRKKLAVNNEEVVVSFFGRLVRQKGAHLLVQALSGLKQLNWKLLLDHHHDNEDLYSSYIHDLIRDLGLEDRVMYFDADHYEIANYMRASDIMVAPSITTPTFKEQYGRAVQEAMACGCVCLVSDSGHPKDLVGDKGLVFKEGDERVLRSLLGKLMSNPEKLKEHSARLRKRAAEYFGVDSHAAGLAGLIRMFNGEMSSISR